MDTTPTDAYNKLFTDMVEDISNREFDQDSTTVSINNLVALAKAQPQQPESELIQPVVPTTRLGKLGAGIARFWDNETTRVLIKSGGALASVVVVGSLTVKKDHVLERQALDQAHQPPVR